MAFATPATLPCRTRPTHHLSTRRSPRATAAVSPKSAPAVDVATLLSERARDIRGYLRAHKSIFYPGPGFLALASALCRKNDTGRILIPSDELDTNDHILPHRAAAEYILAAFDQLVDDAFNSLALTEDQQATADIARHDFAYILRVVSYGIAVGSVHFVHEDNLALMRELHAEVAVPVAKYCDALTTMAQTIADNVDDAQTKEHAAACFKVITDFLSESS